MIEPTDEMEDTYNHASWENPTRNAEEGVDYPNVREGLAAVLALVERDYSVCPALCDEPHPTEDLAYCELQRGHAARSGRGHSATVTKAVDW